jgi:hypothetical protein
MPTLGRIEQPVLGVFAEHDRSAPPGETLDLYRDALEDGAGAHYTLRVIPGAGHGMEPSADGFVEAEADLDALFTDLHPAYVDTVAEWVHTLPDGPGPSQADPAPQQAEQSQELEPVAAGLEAGRITPATRFDTNPGWIPNGRFRTSDFRNYGVLDTTGIITKSSNVGVSKLAARLPNQQFHDFLRRFGYGASTRSGFPGEASGLFPEPAGWRKGDRLVCASCTTATGGSSRPAWPTGASDAPTGRGQHPGRRRRAEDQPVATLP